MPSTSIPKVAIIGAGIFGAMIALRLSEKGINVEIFERANDLLCGASYNNQNRLHLGFHYPRDNETAQQCIEGFDDFCNRFEPCLKKNFPNAYFISEKYSLTSVENYLKFCDMHNLNYKILDLKTFRPKVNECDLGILTNEIVYDAKILRELLRETFKKSSVPLTLNTQIDEIARNENGYILKSGNTQLGEYNYVVNCSYSNINQFNTQLGFNRTLYQYEYTMVPIIKWNKPPLGITIMDGKLMTILPFGHSGNFLLYHVTQSVVSSIESHELPKGWLDPNTSPSSRINHEHHFKNLKKACLQFVPELESSQLVGHLQGPRIVISNQEGSDSRHSIISRPERGYFSVFTGKVVHSMWVTKKITDEIVSN
jgi:hypothetical protein